MEPDDDLISRISILSNQNDDRSGAPSDQQQPVHFFDDAATSGSGSRPRRRLIKRGRCKNFQTFLYDKQHHTFCNKTCKSWLAVLAYFLIFIALAVLLCLLMLFGAIKFLKKYQTRPWMSKKGLIDDNLPGVSFMPNTDYLHESLIWYKPGGGERVDNYVNQIDEYYAGLEAKCKLSKRDCIFNRTSLGPCGAGKFGYDTLNPCIIVRLNKLEDWIPKRYANKVYPELMPDELKEQIANTEETRLWIYCEGFDEYDKDHIRKLDYYPMQGYPQSAFPYTEVNDRYYVSPLVVVHMKDYDGDGRVIALKCSLYASNYNQEKHYDQLARTYIYIEK